MQTSLYTEVNDEIPDNVVVVDIDNDAVFIPDTTSAENPQLPEKEEQKLVKALQEIAEPVRLNRVGAGDDVMWKETRLVLMDSAFLSHLGQTSLMMIIACWREIGTNYA